jgi:hypothetical protein
MPDFIMGSKKGVVLEKQLEKLFARINLLHLKYRPRSYFHCLIVMGGFLLP